MTEGQRVAAVLRRAVAKMNDGGKHWIKGEMRVRVNGETKYCSLGGIDSVTRSSGLRRGAKRALATAIDPESVAGDETIIYRWNDETSRRWRDVKAAFNRAAKLAEKEPA